MQIYIEILTGQCLVPKQQHKLDHLCPQVKPTLLLVTTYYEPDQIPTPVEIYHNLADHLILSHQKSYRIMQ